MNRETAVGFLLLAPIPPRLTGQPDSYLVPIYGKYPLFKVRCVTENSGRGNNRNTPPSEILTY
jgi:hypothetical protein